MLFPINTKSRAVIDLSGIWNFLIPEENQIIDLYKLLPNPTLIGVPGSYNDQVTEKKQRDYVGEFWYEKEFDFPDVLRSERLVLRFGSVTNSCKVYLNGTYLGEHIGGYTPFEFVLPNEVLKCTNVIKILVSNELNFKTLPNAVFLENQKKIIPNFDFFNYSGIHRPVKIYSTPTDFIEDIIVKYEILKNEAIIKPTVSLNSSFDNLEYEVLDEDNNIVIKTDKKEFKIDNPKLWNPLKAYMYKLKVNLYNDKKVLVDTYTELFGLRSIEVINNQIYINDKPFYFKGYGKHEDFPILGRGMNETVISSDFKLMKWSNANSLRTAHYPYSEEFMRMADREGFIVINEVPGVGLFNKFDFDVSNKKEEKNNTWDIMESSNYHSEVIRELISRDKNHPSVISWAIGNEPAGHQIGAKKYFEPLVKMTKELDWEKRAVVIPNIINASPELDEINELVDIICLNRYYGWYLDHGDLEQAKIHFSREIQKWHELYPEKPIMISEFGADTINGFKSIYSNPFTEEYQVEYYKANFEVIDKYPYIIGEHVWNFADFETHPNVRRVDGNKKGIFTRDRKPKMIAHYLKERWK